MRCAAWASTGEAASHVRGFCAYQACGAGVLSVSVTRGNEPQTPCMRTHTVSYISSFALACQSLEFAWSSPSDPACGPALHRMRVHAIQ